MPIETLGLPIPGNAGLVSTNKVTDGSKYITFDMSSLTTDQTITVPNLDSILPVKIGTSIAIGQSSYTLGNDNILLGINSSVDSNSAIGRITFGNTINAVDWSIKFPSTLTSFKTSGLATATSTNVLYFNSSTGQITYGPPSNVSLGQGTESTPTTNVATDTNTGIFQAAANSLSVTANGVEAMRFYNKQFLNSFNGSAGFPAYTFSNDLDCGLYRVGANTLGLATDGIARLQIDTAFLSCLDGSATLPIFAFQFESGGIYRSAANTISFSYGNVLKISLSDSLYTFLGATFPAMSLTPFDTMVYSSSISVWPGKGIHPYGSTIKIGKSSFSSSASASKLYSNVPVFEEVVPSIKYEASAANSFAKSTAISANGQYYVAGAPTATSPGAAYVYSPYVSGSTSLVGTGNVGNSHQGASVAISGDGLTIAVGGPNDNSNIGAVWIFVLSGGSWSQQGSKLTTGTPNSLFGTSVALSYSGDVLAVGAPDGNGTIVTYSRTAGTWSYGGIIEPTDDDDPYATVNIGLGTTLAMSSDNATLIAGAPAGRGGRGVIAIITGVTATAFTAARFYADHSLGTSAALGTSVAISADGKTVAAGAPFQTTNTGTVIVWALNSQYYTQIQTLTASSTNQYFGQYLNLTSDAGLLLIGSSFTATSMDRKTYLYALSNQYLIYKTISPYVNNYDRYGFGANISGDGTVIIIGFEPNAATDLYGRIEEYRSKESSKLVTSFVYVPAGSASLPQYTFGIESNGWFLKSSNNIAFSIAGVESIAFSPTSLAPGTDNYYTLGSSSKKFANVYSTNTVINTSDMRLKKWSECDKGLDFIKKINTYKYKIQNQTSLGLMAQEFLDYNCILQKGESLGLRYSELIPILVKAIQDLYRDKASS